MKTNTSEEAWVELPDQSTIAEAPGRRNHPYNFGYVAGMSRLIMAHSRIAPAFGALYASIYVCTGSTFTSRKGDGRRSRGSGARLPLLSAVSRRVSAC